MAGRHTMDRTRNMHVVIATSQGPRALDSCICLADGRDKKSRRREARDHGLAHGFSRRPARPNQSGTTDKPKLVGYFLAKVAVIREYKSRLGVSR